MKDKADLLTNPEEKGYSLYIAHDKRYFEREKLREYYEKRGMESVDCGAVVRVFRRRVAEK